MPTFFRVWQNGSMTTPSVRVPRTSPSGPRIYVAECAVDHVPPDPPFFICNRGFASIELDTSVLSEGAYILRLSDPNLDMNRQIVLAQYHSQSEQDLGVCFTGHISPVNGPGDRGAFTIVRFQVLPGNITLNGPFMVEVRSAGPLVGPLPLG